jgi:hypothetical protein
MNKNDRMNKIVEISNKIVNQLPYIMKEIDSIIPSMLKSLNWEYHKLEYTNIDTTQFCGMNYDTGSTPTPKYGASTCMLIVYLKTIANLIPVQKVQSTEAETKAETKTSKNNIVGEYLNAARRGATNIKTITKTTTIIKSDIVADDTKDDTTKDINEDVKQTSDDTTNTNTNTNTTETTETTIKKRKVINKGKRTTD